MNLSIEAFCEFLAQASDSRFPAGGAAWNTDAVCAFLRSQGLARPRVFADQVQHDAGLGDWVHVDLDPDHWVRAFVQQTNEASAGRGSISRHTAHGIASRLRDEVAA